jgi:methylated-DNA-[protein]-cysteine S-methyltransferase
VWLPDWHVEAPADERNSSEMTVERGGGAAEEHLRQALRELDEYFAGTRRTFTVTLDLRGTAFYRRVWDAVVRIPYGETRSYAEIAREVAAPAATRAVGAANGANPVAPFVPCHRVVGSDGRLTGYGPGLPLKQRLLVFEDAVPAGEGDYHAWTRRVAARMQDNSVFFGIRGLAIYCRVDCARPLRQRMLPGQVFRSPADASAAGFSPCPYCRPDLPTLLDMS